ncbi:MAG: serine hydrolase [Fodinibius sp.]|nr:serine hydrolase [Fodinibius sp.]
MTVLDFNGMVVTDGLEMRGISSNFSPGEAVVKALKAGVDLMLLSPDELTAIHEIQRAVENGTIAESRIDQSVRKLLQWKKRQGLFENRQVHIDSLSSRIRQRDHQLMADEISRKSLTLIKNEKNVFPITASKFPNVMVVSVSDDSDGDAGSSLVSRMRDYHPNVQSHVLDRRTSNKEKKEMLADAKKADLIVIGSFIHVRSGQEVQLSDDDLDFLTKLHNRNTSALIAFGNPYVVQDLSSTNAQLMAWSSSDSQVRNTVPALFGGSKISGRLPIEIPGLYPINHGITMPQTALRRDQPEVVGLSRDSLQQVDRIMNEAVFDSTFPGGVVAVVKDGVIAYQKGFGYETYKKLNPIKKDAVYDLASLTKVTTTTPAIMKLVSDGKISLDDKVSQYIPEFEEGRKNQITIRNLLLHNSGLPAFRVYIDSLKSEQKIMEAVKNEPLVYKPGTKYEYSDLGFMLLGRIVEIVSDKPLDQYAKETFYNPLGMSATMFNPKTYSKYFADRIPPTEIDTNYRMKTMQAEVHDERAWYLNGVAGHAGLFSSAGDLATYTQMLLSKGSYAGRRYLKPKVVEMFTKRQSPQVNRGYGFDRKSDGFSTAGSLTSDKTFGHTGFTGTSFWIDPERNMAIIILTNRVHPYRSYGDNISQIRAKIADTVVSSIIE